MTAVAFWTDKRVLITGHTGYKGSWLTILLRSLGADVSGYSLPAPTHPSLFALARLETTAGSINSDVRDLDGLCRAIAEARPEIVFHLAAQSLVRRSYEDPVETYGTNVMGTLHLLEAVRRASGVVAVVIVTSDKCYENREWSWPYRENDALGGADPYSSSKGCAELLVDSYRRSYFRTEGQSIAVATARAGNVIGGGDFAVDRLIPDLVRSVGRGMPAEVRNPNSVRPWQHVLDALSGYVLLAERLYAEGGEFAEAWNFGPTAESCRTVAEVADAVVRLWPGGPAWEVDGAAHPAESRLLALDSSKAHSRLGWRPRWGADEAIERTVGWYRRWMDGGANPAAARDGVLADLESYGIPPAAANIDEDPIPRH
jgi:CDP-glucose 4,6-dehydratase